MYMRVEEHFEPTPNKLSYRRDPLQLDSAHAARCIERMQLRPLLDRVRGNPAADVDSFCKAASRFSVMADALGDVLSELDVNLVIVGEHGSVAVDALAVGRDRREPNRAKT